MRNAYSSAPLTSINQALASKFKRYTLPDYEASLLDAIGLRSLSSAPKLAQGANNEAKEGNPTYQEKVRERIINNDKISDLQLGSLKLLSTIQSLRLDQFKPKKKVRVNKKSLLNGSISSLDSNKAAGMKGNVKLALAESEPEENSKLNHIFEIPQFTPASVNNILYLLNNINIKYNIDPMC